MSHPPTSNSQDFKVRAAAVINSVKALSDNVAMKPILLWLESRTAESFSHYEIKACQWILDNLVYANDITIRYPKQEVWTSLGGCKYNQLAQILSQNIEPVISMWVPSTIEYTTSKDGMLMSDLDDLYYQLLYLIGLTRTVNAHSETIELQKAMIVISKMVNLAPKLYSDMQKALRGLMCSDKQLLEMARLDTQWEEAKKAADRNRVLKVLRKRYLDLARGCKKQYEGLKLDDYTQIIDGDESYDEKDEYCVKSSEWQVVGLDKYMKEVEIKYKSEFISTINQTTQFIASNQEQIHSLELLINKATQENKSAIEVEELWDQAQEYNPYKLWIKHYETSLDKFAELMSPAITANKVSVALCRFSKIRALFNLYDEENLMDDLQNLINELYTIEGSYTGLVKQYSQHIQQLQTGVFDRLPKTTEQDVQSGMNKLDGHLAQIDSMLRVINHHSNRYLSRISKEPPSLPSQISVKHAIALYQPQKMATDNLEYLSRVEANLEQDTLDLRSHIDLVQEMNLSEAKEFILVELIHAGAFLQEYEAGWLEVAHTRLKYLETKMISHEGLLASVQLKLKTIEAMLFVLHKLQEETLNILREVQESLTGRRSLHEIAPQQLAVTRLEMKLKQFIDIYNSNEICEGCSVSLLIGLKQIMAAYDMNTVSAALTQTWPNPDAQSIRASIIKQEPNTSNNMAEFESNIPNSSDFCSSWRDLQDKLLLELNYNEKYSDSNEEKEPDKTLNSRKRKRIELADNEDSDDIILSDALNVESTTPETSLLAFYQPIASTINDQVIPHIPIPDLENY